MQQMARFQAESQHQMMSMASAHHQIPINQGPLHHQVFQSLTQMAYQDPGLFGISQQYYDATHVEFYRDGEELKESEV